jgi:hypothetical protein
VKSRKKIRPSKIFLVLLISALAITACGGANTSILEVSDSDIATQSAVLQESLATAVVDESPGGETQEDAQPGEDTPAEVPADNPPASLPVIPRLNLGANWFQPTNPIGVQVASGGIQIIEFSAYW